MPQNPSIYFLALALIGAGLGMGLALVFIKGKAMIRWMGVIILGMAIIALAPFASQATKARLVSEYALNLSGLAVMATVALTAFAIVNLIIDWPAKGRQKRPGLTP